MQNKNNKKVIYALLAILVVAIAGIAIIKAVPALTSSNGLASLQSPSTWPLLAPSGLDSAPSYNFSNYTNSGMNNINGFLNFSTNGTKRLTIDPNGSVGIGVNTPTGAKLEVNGLIKTTPTTVLTACNSSTKGGIYYNSGSGYNHFYGCIYDTSISAYRWKQLDN